MVLVRRLLMYLAQLTVIWAGAAVIAFGVQRAFDGNDVQDADLEQELNDYARRSEISVLGNQVKELRQQLTNPATEGNSAGIERAVATLLLVSSARGQLRADTVKNSYFPTATASDYQACIDWLAGRSTNEIIARESCGRVIAVVEFGP